MNRILGFAGSAFAVAVTLTEFEQLLRVTGAGIGVLLGALAVYDWFAKRRRGEKP